MGCLKFVKQSRVLSEFCTTHCSLNDFPKIISRILKKISKTQNKNLIQLWRFLAVKRSLVDKYYALPLKFDLWSKNKTMNLILLHTRNSLRHPCVYLKPRVYIRKLQFWLLQDLILEYSKKTSSKFRNPLLLSVSLVNIKGNFVSE